MVPVLHVHIFSRGDYTSGVQYVVHLVIGVVYIIHLGLARVAQDAPGLDGYRGAVVGCGHLGAPLPGDRIVTVDLYLSGPKLKCIPS